MYAAVIGMISKANSELKQYLSSSDPVYGQYTEGLWVEEVNSAAQLGSQSCTHMVSKVLFMLVISLLCQRQQL